MEKYLLFLRKKRLLTLPRRLLMLRQRILIPDIFSVTVFLKKFLIEITPDNEYYIFDRNTADVIDRFENGIHANHLSFKI